MSGLASQTDPAKRFTSSRQGSSPQGRDEGSWSYDIATSDGGRLEPGRQPRARGGVHLTETCPARSGTGGTPNLGSNTGGAPLYVNTTGTDEDGFPRCRHRHPHVKQLPGKPRLKR
jgi:hypothetical protein